MAKTKCKYCGKLFVPDPRVGARQKACSLECQKLRKKENNLAFAKNNQDYWKGRYSYLLEWRQRHPDYQRQWRQGRKNRAPAAEIQAERLGKAFELSERIGLVLRKIQAEMFLKALEIAQKKAPLSFHAP